MLQGISSRAAPGYVPEQAQQPIDKEADPSQWHLWSSAQSKLDLSRSPPGGAACSLHTLPNDVRREPINLSLSSTKYGG